MIRARLRDDGAVTSADEESGRPGSNGHHQLGRSAKRILANSRELKYQVNGLRELQ